VLFLKKTPMKLTHLIAAFALAAFVMGSTSTHADIVTASDTITNSPVSISFTLPEVALSGSLLLTFNDRMTAHELTLASEIEGLGLHTFTFDTTTSTATPEIASGGVIPDGVYTLTFQDALSNPITLGTSTNVTIDTVAPVLNHPPEISVQATSASGAVMNFSVTATDATDVSPNLSVIPPSGSVFPEGDVLNGKIIKSFSILGEVLGSEGQRRAWAKDDMSARVIYHVFFTDATSGILSSGIP